MAAKGAVLKKEVAEKILAAFPGNSFLFNDGKEIRINGTEDGQKLQIKITLTCAKVAVEGGSEVTSSGEVKATGPAPQIPDEPTAEEKERLATLLEQLNL